MLRLFLPLALAALLVGCAREDVNIPGGSPLDPSLAVADRAEAILDTVAVHGTSGLIIAEEFYQAANRTALAAVKTGMLPDPVLVRIQELNRTATKALERGKNASDDATRARAAAEVLTAALELRRLGSR